MEDRATLEHHAPRSLPLCAPESRPYLLAAAILASSLGFIDGSIVAIALPSIRVSLDATLLEAQWVSNGYLLTLSALILVGGATGDRFGLARVFGLGIALFVLASLACAFAPTATFLILARGVQGFAAAFMVPGSLALISRAYPNEERGRAIGIWAASAAVTSALGPILGGLVISAGGMDSWRWIFAVNLPLGALALFFLYSKVTQDPAQPERGLDIPGAIAATLGLGLFAWALSGAEHGNVPNMENLIAGAIGLAVIGIFLRIEARSPHPMMPLSLFRNRGFSAANLVAFCIYFSFSAVLMYLPMLLIGGWGLSAIATSAAYAPLSVFIALLSGLAGSLATRYGPTPLLIAGSLVLATGYAALAMVIPSQNFWYAVLPAMCFQGVGMALIVAPLSSQVMGSVEPHAGGTASGINNAVTRMAGLIAVAAMGSVVALQYGALDGPATYGQIMLDPGHTDASNAAFITVAWAASALCVISAVIAWFGGRVPVRT
ncbi:EmrB/QacA subfamily drug resistance transporter [Litoreibacter ponti]|uniref:EmrB/QacA subfamily drug resistance transporter n=1 Tax=Litoreibacter ponti TaxID=1510457 RepID=A0A2T6BI71_9RHOB|nr:MFS transporter [Litoreibacter ponti]PTX55746.1 EmrB/QacA subfamily drug resistance transporter [Litoreibacter ponti]